MKNIVVISAFFFSILPVTLIAQGVKIKAPTSPGSAINKTASSNNAILVGSKSEVSAKLKANPNATIGLNGQTITLKQIIENRRAIKAVTSAAKTKTFSSNQKKTPTLIANQGSGLNKFGIKTSPNATQSLNKKSCDERAPIITNVGGTVTPGAPITLQALCIGKAAGKIRVYGPFQNGFLDLSILSWSGTKIVAQIPENVKGVSDSDLKMELLRSDGKISNSANVRFIANREISDVTYLWKNPEKGKRKLEESDILINEDFADNSIYAHNIIDTGASFGISSEKVLSSSAHVFSIRINPLCYLDSMAWTTHAGSIISVNGWESGPPNEANISINGRFDEKLWVHWYGDDLEKTLSYQITAKANCPAGISPNP